MNKLWPVIGVAVIAGCSRPPAPPPGAEFPAWVDAVAAETLRDGHNPRPVALAPGTRIGTYEIVAPLGAGGRG